MEGIAPIHFMTSALNGGEWSASRPGRALPQGKGLPVSSGKDAGWASAGLDTDARRKILCIYLESNLDRPVVQSVARHYTD
jgi:hypothetical protein